MKYKIIVFLIGSILILYFKPFSGTSNDDHSVAMKRLEGVWKSDWVLTERHFEEETRMTDEQIEVSSRLMGKMTVEFKDNIVIQKTPRLNFGTKAEPIMFDAHTSKSEIEIIGVSKEQIAIRTLLGEGKLKVLNIDPGTDYHKYELGILQFINSDTFYVYLGHIPLLGGNRREYFTRVKAK